MTSKIATKSARCSGSSLASAARRPASSSARIIWRTAVMRLASKNMCSVRHRPMPSAPNCARHAAIVGRFGIGAHLHPADAVGPDHQRAEIARQFRLDRRHFARHDLAR